MQLRNTSFGEAWKYYNSTVTGAYYQTRFFLSSFIADQLFIRRNQFDSALSMLAEVQERNW